MRDFATQSDIKVDTSITISLQMEKVGTLQTIDRIE